MRSLSLHRRWAIKIRPAGAEQSPDYQTGNLSMACATTDTGCLASGFLSMSALPLPRLPANDNRGSDHQPEK
jgi:hypothetical protein